MNVAAHQDEPGVRAEIEQQPGVWQRMLERLLTHCRTSART